MQVVGVSFNTVDENQSWALDEGFEFDVWTDDDKALAVYYGAAKTENASYPDRVTFLRDAEGTVLLEYTDSINVGTHPGQVLEDCEKLF